MTKFLSILYYSTSAGARAELGSGIQKARSQIRPENAWLRNTDALYSWYEAFLKINHGKMQNEPVLFFFKVFIFLYKNMFN